MAEIIEAYSFPAKGHRSMYPWDEWLDGQARKLTRPFDFKGSARCLQTNAARVARERGLRIQTRIPDDNTVILRAVPRD
jgi:hypothetical protein